MNARSTDGALPTQEQRGLASRQSQTRAGGTTPPLQQVSDAAVWVYRSDRFNFSRGPANGWGTSYGFTTLEGLVNVLTTEGHAYRKINKLGICAHGDHAGTVQISTATSIRADNIDHPSILRWLTHLESFLTTDAQVVFFSCIAGQSEAGTLLLRRLSRLWRNRTIIGFTTFGYIDTSFSAPNAPGNVYETGQTVDAQVTGQFIRSGQHHASRMNINSPTAKWVRNDVVIRTPLIDI
jgi:hypothetical protein